MCGLERAVGYNSSAGYRARIGALWLVIMRCLAGILFWVMRFLVI
jgi:hypothetical protein